MSSGLHCALPCEDASPPLRMPGIIPRRLLEYTHQQGSRA